MLGVFCILGVEDDKLYVVLSVEPEGDASGGDEAEEQGFGGGVKNQIMI